MTPHDRILVVDDNDATRYSIARVLKRAGYQVSEANDGWGALEVARREHPDLVVLDVVLPDIIGYEVAERLKADPETDCAILHLSASFTEPEAQAEGLRRGADGYLTHPVDGQVLSATVGALLRLRRAELQEKRARERAEASEARQRFLADMVPQLVWSTNAAGELEYVNRRWIELTGMSLNEARQDRWKDTIYPGDQPRLVEAWMHALATGEAYQIEARQGNPRTGVYRWFLIRAVPMHDEAGKIVRWFGTCTDVEEHKRVLADRDRLLGELTRTARERQALVEKLRDEAARKNEFLAILGHELRNPLAPIANSVYILEHAPPGGDQARRAREIIDRQTRQLTRLVDDLLEVTRMTRGKIRLQDERVVLSSLVRTVADDHRHEFVARGIELDVELTEAPLAVRGDPTRLAQIIGNLLNNAAKFTPRGGRVTLALAPDHAGGAAVRVADTGAGIQPELLDRLFEPFVQADRTLDRSKGGLGLGLSLVKGLVELHGGTVSAESKGPGQGAVFTVRLPLEPAEARDAAEAARHVPSSPGRRVLIVEDNIDAAESLKEALELSRYNVELVHDGADALARARELRPDVVLCDLGLPGMDGYELARALRSEPSLGAVILIALSGYASIDDVRRSQAAGFDAHVAKPPDLAVLESLLERGGASPER